MSDLPPVPPYPSPGGGGGPVTVADGADVTLGAIADAAVSTDANGTVNAHIRGLVKMLASVLGVYASPSTEMITVQGPLTGGSVPVYAIVPDGQDVAEGATTDAAVSTDANGTVNAHIRGIVKLLAAKIGITIADGDSAALGATTDAAVSTDANGTVNGHIRGLVKLLASVLGTAGSPSTEVVTVQGVTSGTAVIVQESQSSSIASNGVLVPGGSAAQLPSVAGKLAYITACKANTGTIYLGRSSAVTSTTGTTNTTTGLEMQAGQQVGPLPITNLNLLWAAATVSTDALTYIVI